MTDSFSQKDKETRLGELLFYKSDNHLLDVNFDFCGLAHGDGASSPKPRIKNNFVLHYILTGSGEYIVNDQIFKLKKGDCFLLPKNIATQYWGNPDDPWHYLWIGLSGTKINEYLKRSELGHNYIVHNTPGSNFVSSMHEIVTLVENNGADQLPANYDLLLNSHIYQMLYQLAFEHPHKITETLSIKEAYIYNAIQQIQSNYQQQLTIESLAATLNINRSYLHRIFKQVLNISPQQYLIRIRLEKSQQLLVETNHSIKEIAYSVGYHDALNFSKLFSTHFNMSPSEYRKQFGLTSL